MTKARLSNAKNIQSFLAQSPPAWNSPSTNSAQSHGASALKPQMGGIQAGSSPFLSTPNRTTSPLTLSAREGLTLAVGDATPGGRSPQSSICILPTSLPEYHRAYMAGNPRAAPTEALSTAPCNDIPSQDAAAPAAPPVVNNSFNSAVASPLPGIPSPVLGTSSTSKRRPRNGSRPLTPKLPGSSGRPEPLTPLSNTQFQQQMIARQQMMHQPSETVKKPKPTRWQFGIRSRNPPLEAVSCIYRALKKLGAEWVSVEEENDEDDYSDDYDSEAYCGSGAEGSQEDTNYSGEDGNSGSGSGRVKSTGEDNGAVEATRRSSKRNRRARNLDQEGEKIKPAEDPWVIHCRWRKDGMAHLKDESFSYNQSSPVLPPLASTPKDGASVDGGSSRRTSTATGMTDEATESVYVHMEIQLYKLENSFYLVDFKCGGYERIFDDEDDEEYISESGSEVEYEYDDGIPDEDYVPDDEDEPPQPITAESEKRVLAVTNNGAEQLDDQGETVGGQGGSKKKVGFTNGDDPQTMGQNSRRGSTTVEHCHHHHHHYHHHSHHGDGLSERGRKPQEDKDVTSPFPFLDMATKLIIQLAEAD